MKTRFIFFAALIIPSFLSAQTYFYAESISIDPVNPTDQDPVTITVSGNLSSTASQVDSTSFALAGIELSLKLYCSTGIGIPVLTPHSEPIQVGLLDAGDYHIQLSGPGLGNFVSDTTQFYFTVASTVSNEYFPFIKENKVWSELTESWGNYWTTFYKFEGDTSFNNTSYKKVFISNDSLMLQWSPDNYLYYREDENGKVYQYWPGSDSEVLLYDFSMQAGDVYNIEGFQITVETVDSVQIDNEYRKRIIFEWGDEIWIEGIGSLTGPFKPFANILFADISWELLCVEQDFNLIYQKPGTDECFYYVIDEVDETFADSNQINIFPQPASDFVTIQITEPKTSLVQIEVLNMLGEVVLQETMSDSKVVLNTTTLLPGLYLIRLNTGVKSIQGKLMINN